MGRTGEGVWFMVVLWLSTCSWQSHPPKSVGQYKASGYILLFHPEINRSQNFSQLKKIWQQAQSPNSELLNAWFNLRWVSPDFNKAQSLGQLEARKMSPLIINKLYY